MAWPARSPDLNPIQHVWVMLGRRIAGRSVPPGTLHELQQALLQEWALLPQQAIKDTIASMPRRCQACVSARGRWAAVSGREVSATVPDGYRLESGLYRAMYVYAVR
ncbi:hypothetical protein AVEN_53384-1 [Araneus ventricosus]|uniref:Tc1-like transposase DDE domain-containing protein n=1 Tax=Araneus ventricosus TaxID=182803 RepID=A0A4Y2ABJ3_ARAVE|nr:hypothetical protein AVEN_53384-1 [Araneus ventricosus]